MNRVIKTIVSTLGATLMLASTAMPAFATYTTPDAGDMNNGLVTTVLQVTKLNVLAPILNGSNVKVVDVKNILNDAQIIELKNSLNNPVSQNNITILQNALNLKNVLTGGVNIITFGDFLSNNNFNLKDVIAINVFDDGKVLVFCCH